MLFNEILMILADAKIEFDVRNGLMYGHRMIVCKNKNFKVIEINSNKVCVEMSFGTHWKNIDCFNSEQVKFLLF